MILFIDDEPARMASHIEELQIGGYAVTYVATVAEFRGVLAGPETPEAVLLDLMIPMGDLDDRWGNMPAGALLLDEIRKRWPAVPSYRPN